MEQQEAGCSLEGWQVPNQTTLLASVFLKQHSLFSHICMCPTRQLGVLFFSPCCTIYYVSCTNWNFNDSLQWHKSCIPEGLKKYFSHTYLTMYSKKWCIIMRSKIRLQKNIYLYIKNMFKKFFVCAHNN